MSELKLRPSGSARWLACPASLKLEEMAVVDKTSVNIPAYLGSATHELLETCLNTGDNPQKHLGEEITIFDEESMELPYTIKVTQTMVDSVQFFLDFVLGTELDAPHKVYAEYHMSHSKIKGLEGTADFLRIYDRCADLYDLKNGTSIVQVRNRKGELNTQLGCYAGMVFDEFPEVDTVDLAIVQPNGKTKKKVRESVVDREEIDALMERVAAATSQNHFEIGSHCFWCRAKNICPKQAEAAILREFEEI